MPIVKICQGQPELRVRITTTGDNGAQLVDYKHLRLVISAPCEPRSELPLSPQEFKGCWPGHDTAKWNSSFELPERRPLLIYPAFDTDENGDIVFRLDSQIWNRLGRYIGTVETTSGQKILALDLDICSNMFIPDRISVVSTSCGD